MCNVIRHGMARQGLDCSETVLKNFFKEQNLEYSERSDENFKVFYSTNPLLNISLYAGDIFDLPKSSIPQCNAVWDYASIVVIKSEVREKYVRAITSKLSAQANYLLCTFDFERFEMPNGPAYHTTPEMVQKLFGSDFEVNYLKDIVSEHKVFDKVLAMKNFFHMVKK